MHRQVMAFWMALTVSGLCFAQNPSSSRAHQDPTDSSQQSTSASRTNRDEPTIAIELSKSLDARKLKQGDLVKARTTEEVRTGNGRVIPRGTIVQGHITQARARAKGETQSSLGIAFDNILLKDGQQLPLKATIQAVGAPVDWAPNNPANGNPGMGGQPPVMAPGTPANSPGGQNPIGGINPAGGYPQMPSPQRQTPSAQPDTNNPTSLTPESTGVVGMPEVSLQPNSVLTSSGKDLKLDSGTEMILRVQDQ